MSILIGKLSAVIVVMVGIGAGVLFDTSPVAANPQCNLMCVAGSGGIYYPDYCAWTQFDWTCDVIAEELCYTGQCSSGGGGDPCDEDPDCHMQE